MDSWCEKDSLLNSSFKVFKDMTSKFKYEDTIMS